MARFSYSNSKSCSLEKLSPLPDFSSGTRSHCQKSDQIIAFVAPKMTDLITFLNNNGKSDVYTGGDIHRIYHYLELNEYPETFTTPFQCSRHFSPLYSINNDAETIMPVISDLRMTQKIICECCGIIEHKADACIIRGPKFLSPSLRRNINQFNTLHGDEPN